MELLSRVDADRVRHLFDSEHLSLVIDAVAAGNSPARVWVDALAAPRAALIWDGCHSVYLVGSIERADWRNLFDREVAPAGRGVLKAYVTDGAAKTVFSGYPLQRRERVLFRGGRRPIPDWRTRVPTGFQISVIDDRLAGSDTLANAVEVITEIESCWESLSDFRRNGFGLVAHDARAIVCWCTAEFVSDGKCGIGIETIPAYRGRGFATVTASAFLEHCAERAMTPHWDAWVHNAPSVAVAERIGLDKVETYAIYVCDFGDVATTAPTRGDDGSG